MFVSVYVSRGSACLLGLIFILTTCKIGQGKKCRSQTLKIQGTTAFCSGTSANCRSAAVYFEPCAMSTKFAQVCSVHLALLGLCYRYSKPPSPLVSLCSCVSLHLSFTSSCSFSRRTLQKVDTFTALFQHKSLFCCYYSTTL